MSGRVALGNKINRDIEEKRYGKGPSLLKHKTIEYEYHIYMFLITLRPNLPHFLQSEHILRCFLS